MPTFQSLLPAEKWAQIETSPNPIELAPEVLEYEPGQNNSPLSTPAVSRKKLLTHIRNIKPGSYAGFTFTCWDEVHNAGLSTEELINVFHKVTKQPTPTTIPGLRKREKFRASIAANMPNWLGALEQKGGWSTVLSLDISKVMEGFARLNFWPDERHMNEIRTVIKNLGNHIDSLMILHGFNLYNAQTDNPIIRKRNDAVRHILLGRFEDSCNRKELPLRMKGPYLSSCASLSRTPFLSFKENKTAKKGEIISGSEIRLKNYLTDAGATIIENHEYLGCETGNRPDIICEWNGNLIIIETDGPSHFDQMPNLGERNSEALNASTHFRMERTLSVLRQNRHQKSPLYILSFGCMEINLLDKLRSDSRAFKLARVLNNLVEQTPGSYVSGQDNYGGIITAPHDHTAAIQIFSSSTPICAA